jgi:hypothetical protein
MIIVKSRQCGGSYWWSPRDGPRGCTNVTSHQYSLVRCEIQISRSRSPTTRRTAKEHPDPSTLLF